MLKISSVNYDFSSVQLDFPKKIADKVINWGKKNIDENDIYNDPDDDSLGREDNIHVTVKFGLHTSNPEEVKKVIEGFGEIPLKLGKVSKFDTNDDFDVIKIDIESDKLHQLNKLISKELECTDTHPKYIPHATVAYVTKGSCKDLVGNKFFVNEEHSFENIVFSPKNGKKEKINLLF